MVNMTRGILDEATGASEAIKGKMYALQKLKESPPPPALRSIVCWFPKIMNKNYKFKTDSS